MRQFSIIAATLSLPLLLWMGALALPTLADEAETTEGDGELSEELEEAIAAELLCTQAVMETGNALLVEHAEFLDAYFKSTTQSTSEQVMVAMDYQRYVEDSLTKVYQANATPTDFETGADLDLVRHGIQVCEDTLVKYQRMNDGLLEHFSLTNGSTRQTYQMMDAMDLFNEHLSELQINFTQTFPGSFNTMNNSFDCYAKACIGS